MLTDTQRPMLRYLLTALLFSLNTVVFASGGLGPPRDISYPFYPAAPAQQSQEEAHIKSVGCLSCHSQTDAYNMHSTEGINLGCIDCHGGNSDIFKPDGYSDNGHAQGHSILYDKEPQSDDNHHQSEVSDTKASADEHHTKAYPEAYQSALDQAHVQPLYPEAWHYPSSANPERSYTLLNEESREFVRFINPSDYRVAREGCGACHLAIIKASERSLMSNAAMFWGAAAYNNGILPYKRPMIGEAYTPDGEPAALEGRPAESEEIARKHNIISRISPLPAWETTRPGDIFRVFERGGRNLTNLFPETGNPNSLGLIQRLEEPGRPDFKQSNRGPGTGQRISVPVLNMTKTRLNDPMSWFMGTNDQPGDYRQSGCAGCHVIYANDRSAKHSAGYGQYGHEGKTITIDPTIPKDESGHPLEHKFTRAIPSSQCIVCHMHQPNMFVNTFLGYTMWDYESDAPSMWPKEQKYPTAEEMRKTNARNPEGAAVRGKWGDIDFLKQVSEMNPELNDTQFADYHGHGWNFRAVFKRDRDGNLLTKDEERVANDDPKKFDKGVHMSSIHLDVGMHCVDCHYSQDSHSDGHIYGEVAAAVEIGCVDCHGTISKYPDQSTSGPAGPGRSTDLSLIRNPDGQKRFEWVGKKLMQRSAVTDGLEWQLSLVKDTVSKGHSQYNEKAAKAKLMSTDTKTLDWGLDFVDKELAHDNEDMECFACHTSWTTSCGGCHLPIEANWKTERKHYEGGESRNYATYNPQVVRDQTFMLGKHSTVKGNKIAPIRSTSALVLSSTNANREKIYVQQPPISSSGYSSQAFNPHFPHTARKEETKTCDDCHLSQENDNNAIMAQLLMHGTHFYDFLGYHAYLGTTDGVSAVQVTEWEEPQAVIGSYLQKYAYPDFYQKHQELEQELPTAHHNSGKSIGCLQLRGEYLYAAEGSKGMNVYDVASIANKGISQRIIEAPFSELGHDTQVESKNATCLSLSTTQPIAPDRNQGELMREVNEEQPFHPIYNYALITDSEEGLILSNINTLADGDFRNNQLERALTWNPKGVLNGAKHITTAGYYVYVTTDDAIVVLNLDKPLNPQVVAEIEVDDPRATAIQFRYLFVTTAAGLSVVDVTNPEDPSVVKSASIPLENAQRMHLARTYAYVAAGKQGIAVIDIIQPTKPKLVEHFTANGEIKDARDIVVASTNASLFAYVADGEHGLKVVQLTAPDTQPNFYGFSPAPKPELIAWYKTASPAISLSKGLERDRGADETGGQMAVFGRLGSRPFNQQEMQKLYLDKDGKPWYVPTSKVNKRLLEERK